MFTEMYDKPKPSERDIKDQLADDEFRKDSLKEIMKTKKRDQKSADKQRKRELATEQTAN
jgi:hypothetical protein